MTAEARRGSPKLLGAVLLGLAAIGSPATLAARADAREPVSIPQDVGTWPLSVLAGTGTPLPLHGRVAVRPVPFQLPATARQGERLWYTVTLHARMEFAPGASGSYVVSADTNGRSAAALSFRVSPKRVIAQGLGLISGEERRVTAERTVDLSVENFAQYAGIRGGLNQLNLRVRTEAGRAPRSVEILPDTSIRITRAGPDELIMRVTPRRTTVRLGKRVRVPFTLTRQGRRPDGPVEVRIDGPARGIRVVGPSTIRYPSVGRGRRGAFEVEASRPGGYEFVVHVLRRYNMPEARTVIVAAPVRRSANVTLIAALAVGVALIVAGVALRRRRRPAG